MKTTSLLKIKDCTKFLHLSIIVISCLSLFSPFAFSKDINLIARDPASAPEEEVLTMPRFDQPIMSVIFADDDAGVMSGMRNSLNDWEKTEEYSKTWNLESTGLYKTPTIIEKKKMIANKLLKYADKRLAGEVKTAEEGSAFHAVGKVEKSLRPNATVPVAKNISLKFKARVLQGKAVVEVKNPWVEFHATASVNGVRVLTQKEFKELGSTTGIEYYTKNSQLVAYLDQSITANIKARVSTTQSGDSFLANDAEKKLEMTATFPFNF